MKTPPSELNSDTPEWFKDWRNREFWHFKMRVEFYNKLTVIVLVALVSVVIARAIL